MVKHEATWHGIKFRIFFMSVLEVNGRSAPRFGHLYPRMKDAFGFSELDATEPQKLCIKY